MLSILAYSFMRNAFIAGILASVIFGMIGTFVVVKRLVFISGGVSHASFGGVGMGYYLGWNPLWGATLFAVASALGVGLVGKRTMQREDTAIGIVWALGMALGALFMSITPGYLPTMSSVLFGNILMIGRIDIYLMAFLTVVITGTVIMLYPRIQGVSFDEEFSKVVGVRTTVIYLFMLVLVALSIVVLIKLVGIVLLIAMLAIPASISGEFTHDMSRMMVLSSILSLAFIVTGLYVSTVWDLPPGPTIVILAGIVFILVMAVKRVSVAVRGRSHSVG